MSMSAARRGAKANLPTRHGAFEMFVYDAPDHKEHAAFLQEQGRGVLLYLRQEGRGIGLTNKISAYALQEQGLDTVEANLALGLPGDMRDYRIAAEMLLDLGVRRARLLTNNPAKVEGLERYGVEVVERVALRISPNPSNLGYLRTKREKMGHLLSADVPLEAARDDSA
jgi:GTP cyclohydrolase II